MIESAWVEDWSDSFSEFEPRFDLSAHRHAKQLAIALDPSWIRCVIGTRRSGKTEENCLEALEVADQFPGETVPYVLPTIGRDKDVVYQKMQELSDKFALNLHINRSEFKIITPHGGVVQIYGLSTTPDAEKGRGKRFPLVIIDECFVSATPVSPIGKVVRRTSKPAPAVLVGIDGIVSTLDHPYLTPEGWKRAGDIKTGDLLCVWQPDGKEPNEWVAQDVLSGVSLGGALQELDSHAQASYVCHTQGSGKEGRAVCAHESPGSQAIGGVQCSSEEEAEGTRAQAESKRWKRPWAYVAGVDASECDWLKTEPYSPDRTEATGREPISFQVGLSRPIGEVGSGGGRRQPHVQGSNRAGRTQGSVARWQRVDSIEVHERGGSGRYTEVCPDGLVHNLTTESGLYFAGGRLVHNCGSHNQDTLKRAVRETFGPACADFRGLGGRGLLLTGTPGYEPGCYWEQMCGGNTHKSQFGASVHFMTIRDNPFFAGREDLIINAYLSENGISRTDAGFRREWEGEFCSDTEGLCYQRWNRQLLPRHMIPRGGYTVMGLDLGHSPDPCAWVIVRFVVTECVIGDVVRSIHHGHIIASYEQSNASVDQMADITRKLKHAYGVSHIAGDTGGLGATIVDDLATQYNLPIVPVKKTGVKVGRIWMADSMFGAGTLHVHEGCTSLAQQLSAVPWDEKRRHHHPRYPDHSLDAMLYALTLSRQHEIDTHLPPQYGSPQWYAEQEKRDEESVLEFARQRRLNAAA